MQKHITKWGGGGQKRANKPSLVDVCVGVVQRIARAAKFHIDGHCINSCKLIVDDFRTQYTQYVFTEKFIRDTLGLDGFKICCTCSALWLSMAYSNTHTHILYSYVYAHSMDSYYSVMDVKRQALRVAGMMFLFLDVIWQRNNGSIWTPCENLEAFALPHESLQFHI